MPEQPASEYMQRALALAAMAYTSPNPQVGAVVVRDGRVIGEGYHERPGLPHAEVVALEAAGDARGATVYVTLEPCSHHGRTPPCVDALIAAGVVRVVFAIDDPDARVSSAGKAALEAAGIAVEVGDGAAEATRLLEAYIKHRRTGLPFVITKFAASLDGRIAAATGDSHWVSGPETRRWAHDLRTKIDAIIAGASNVVIDDPQLTARPGDTESTRQPLRIVVDSTGRVSPQARVLRAIGQSGPSTELRTGKRAKALVATTDHSSPEWRASIEAAGAEMLVLPADASGRVSLPALLEELGRRDVLTLLVEGGGVLHGSFFDQRLVDKVTAVIAPIVIGAADAPTAVAGRGAQRMADATRLRDITVTQLGDDVLFEGYPVYADA